MKSMGDKRVKRAQLFYLYGRTFSNIVCIIWRDELFDETLTKA
jgi:hypothetical protein